MVMANANGSIGGLLQTHMVKVTDMENRNDFCTVLVQLSQSDAGFICKTPNHPTHHLHQIVQLCARSRLELKGSYGNREGLCCSVLGAGWSSKGATGTATEDRNDLVVAGTKRWIRIGRRWEWVLRFVRGGNGEAIRGSTWEISSPIRQALGSFSIVRGSSGTHSDKRVLDCTGSEQENIWGHEAANWREGEGFRTRVGVKDVWVAASEILGEVSGGTWGGAEEVQEVDRMYDNVWRVLGLVWL
ncbi:hypothetical protein GG344DRAFT_70617 [Lentinula edodes]|nr:hypothetical protein GG344DRAFT_70617 [Lentinula edodes]